MIGRQVRSGECLRCRRACVHGVAASGGGFRDGREESVRSLVNVGGRTTPHDELRRGAGPLVEREGVADEVFDQLRPLPRIRAQVRSARMAASEYRSANVTPPTAAAAGSNGYEPLWHRPPHDPHIGASRDGGCDLGLVSVADDCERWKQVAELRVASTSSRVWHMVLMASFRRLGSRTTFWLPLKAARSHEYMKIVSTLAGGRWKTRPRGSRIDPGAFDPWNCASVRQMRPPHPERQRPDVRHRSRGIRGQSPETSAKNASVSSAKGSVTPGPSSRPSKTESSSTRPRAGTSWSTIMPYLRLRRVGVAAAPELGARDPADQREAFTQPAAGVIIDAMDDPEVLGEDGVARVARRKGAQDLHHADLPERQLLPGQRIADDDVGEVGRVKQPVGALQEHASDLLDHAVEVVDSGQAGLLDEAFRNAASSTACAWSAFQPPLWMRTPLARSSLSRRSPGAGAARP